MTDNEMIDRAYEKALMHLFNVYWQSSIIDSDHRQSDDAFKRGVVELGNVRNRAMRILDGIDKKPPEPPTARMFKGSWPCG